MRAVTYQGECDVKTTKLIAGVAALLMAPVAFAGGTTVPLGATLGVTVGTALGFLLGVPFGQVLPVAASGVLVVAGATLGLGIYIVRRKRRR
jgi:hypothetical protein